jgi:hypothetical protein
MSEPSTAMDIGPVGQESPSRAMVSDHSTGTAVTAGASSASPASASSRTRTPARIDFRPCLDAVDLTGDVLPTIRYPS